MTVDYQRVQELNADLARAVCAITRAAVERDAEAVAEAAEDAHDFAARILDLTPEVR